MKNIILFGGGNQLSYTVDILELNSDYNIVGIIDSIHDIGEIRFGYPVIGRQDQLIDIINRYKIDGGIITIGDNWSRYVVHSTIIKSVPNFEFVNAIHPSVIISKKAKLGKGIVAMAGCIMNTN